MMTITCKNIYYNILNYILNYILYIKYILQYITKTHAYACTLFQTPTKWTMLDKRASQNQANQSRHRIEIYTTDQ